MSFDLTARADDDCSRFAPRDPLAAFVATLPDVRRLGPELFALLIGR